MIPFVTGQYYARFKRFPLPDYTCPCCGAEGTVHLSMGCVVNHLMFIPFSPEIKRVSQRCCNCREEGIPEPEHVITAERMLDEIRRPWYLYMWLWIFAAAAVTGGVMLAINKLWSLLH